MDLVKFAAETAAKQAANRAIEFLGSVALQRWREYQDRRKERLEDFGRHFWNILDIGNITPQPVADRIAVPILESASLEDDEDIQKKYAGLLASAADPASRDRVHPSFIEILKNLSPQEVKFLDACHDIAVMSGNSRLGEMYRLEDTYRCIGLATSEFLDPSRRTTALPGPTSDEWRLNAIIEHLQALGLFSRESKLDIAGYLQQKVLLSGIGDNPGENPSLMAYSEPENHEAFDITRIGVEFVAACRGPQTINRAQPNPAE